LHPRNLIPRQFIPAALQPTRVALRPATITKDPDIFNEQYLQEGIK
jgi:hypothetical protein